MLLDRERMGALVEENAGKPDQRVEPRVDQVALFRAYARGRCERARWAVPLLRPRLFQGFPDLLHFFVLRLDLSGQGLPARHPIRSELISLLGELGVAGLQREVLLALAAQVPLESRRVFPELVDLAKHSLAVEAPLDLVRLQSVAVTGDHLELLAQAGKFRCSANQLGLQSGRLPLGGFDGLASPVTVCRGRVTIRGGLVALLPRRV